MRLPMSHQVIDNWTMKCLKNENDLHGQTAREGTKRVKERHNIGKTGKKLPKTNARQKQMKCKREQIHCVVKLSYSFIHCIISTRFFRSFSLAFAHCRLSQCAFAASSTRTQTFTLTHQNPYAHSQFVCRHVRFGFIFMLFSYCPSTFFSSSTRIACRPRCISQWGRKNKKKEHTKNRDNAFVISYL